MSADFSRDGFVRTCLWLCEMLSSYSFPQDLLRGLRHPESGGPDHLVTELLGRAETAAGFAMDEPLAGAWGAAVCAAALMSARGVSAHDPRMALGRALCGVAGEADLGLLLSASSPAEFERVFVRMATLMGAERLRVDWAEMAALLHDKSGTSSTFVTASVGARLPAKIAADFHRAAAYRGRTGR